MGGPTKRMPEANDAGGPTPTADANAAKAGSKLQEQAHELQKGENDWTLTKKGLEKQLKAEGHEDVKVTDKMVQRHLKEFYEANKGKEDKRGHKLDNVNDWDKVADGTKVDIPVFKLDEKDGVKTKEVTEPPTAPKPEEKKTEDQLASEKLDASAGANLGDNVKDQKAPAQVWKDKDGKPVGVQTPEGKVYQPDGEGNWTSADGKDKFKGKFEFNDKRELVETRESKDGKTHTVKTYEKDGSPETKTVDSPAETERKANEAKAEESKKNKDLGYPEDIKRNSANTITEFTDQGSVWSRGEDGKFRPAGAPDFPNPRSDVKEENGVLTYKQRRESEPASETEVKVDRNNGTREESYTENDVKHDKTFNRNDNTNTLVETNNNNNLEISRTVQHNPGKPDEWKDTTNSEGRTISQGGGKSVIQIKPDGSYHIAFGESTPTGGYAETSGDYPSHQVMYNPVAGRPGTFEVRIAGEAPRFFNPDGTVTDK